MKKYWYKILLGLIVLLALTNPTVNDFKEYANSTGRREGYFLVFSTFQIHDEGITYLGEAPRHKKYIGIFKNFFPLD